MMANKNIHRDRQQWHTRLEHMLRCPDCGAELTHCDNCPVCSGCGRIFGREDGIYLLLPKREEAPPKFYNDPDYQRFISQIVRLHAEHYRPGSITGFIESRMKKPIARFAKKEQPPYIDLGCGTGQGFSFFGQDQDIIGIDCNLGLLRQCRRKHPLATLICCDMLHPPFRPGSMQTLFCINTLEHVFHLEAFLASIEDILADNGHLYVEIPCEGGLLWGIGRRLVTAPRNSRLLGIDYNKVIKKDHCNTAYTVNNVIEKHFIIENKMQYPFRIGGINFNLALIYHLRKRT